MKRLVVIAVLSALTLAGCKTTESNYRESYEAAVRSRNAAEADRQRCRADNPQQNNGGFASVCADRRRQLGIVS